MRTSVRIAALVSIAGVGLAETRSVWDGVFTAEQARRGQARYNEICASCHGEDGRGRTVPAGMSCASEDVVSRSAMARVLNFISHLMCRRLTPAQRDQDWLRTPALKASLRSVSSLKGLRSNFAPMPRASALGKSLGTNRADAEGVNYVLALNLHAAAAFVPLQTSKSSSHADSKASPGCLVGCQAR